MTKEEMVKDFQKERKIVDEKCRSENCSYCKYIDYEFCKTSRLAEALYDAGYRKRETVDDMPDAYAYTLKRLENLSRKDTILLPQRQNAQLLFVEDGSVELQALSEYLEKVAPNVKIVVYAKGSQCPKLVEVEE